jgi:ADP-ribose pyrophosphatase YjhB (NUDIX family)
MRHKVLAYITRERDGRRELLVFTHRDDPEAGVQVPAGTVEPGEPIEDALFREIREESGLTDVQLVRKLAEHEEVEWDNFRHVFHLIAPNGAPDRWTHIVHGQGEDAGMVFEYRWVDLSERVELAGAQHKWLGLLNGGGME